MTEKHEHTPHPNFARGQETEEHGSDEPRPDFARGNREGGEVTTESERGTFAEGKHVHDEPQGDFARGARDDGVDPKDETNT